MPLEKEYILTSGFPSENPEEQYYLQFTLETYW